MRVQNSLLLARSALRLAIAGRLADGIETEEEDKPTSARLTLPRYPNFRDVECRRLADKLIEPFKSPKSDVARTAAFVESIQEEFAELEAQSPDANGEVELLRCLVYLAYPLRTGDGWVVDSVAQYCQKFPEQRGEFLYIGCWAARRMKQFAKAIEFATEGIALAGEDGRFYNGLALSKYSWLHSAESGACPWTVTDVISDAGKALGLVGSDLDRNRDIIAAINNNLAYFYIESLGGTPERLDYAARHFNELVRVLPRAAWTPNYPEYYHTEALLLYETYLAERRAGATESTARPRLVRAMAALRSATSITCAEEYERLADLIEHRLAGRRKQRSS